MNYELAKKLKDAGFLQKHLENHQHFIMEKDVLHNPTLSELIEACGIEFGKLERYYDEDFTKDEQPFVKWVAKAYDSHIYPDGRGKTPEEAVANLWLELNKK